MFCVCVCVCERERERESEKNNNIIIKKITIYHSVPGKCPCTSFQGATVATSIQTYEI